jgi:hypothetical protein
MPRLPDPDFNKWGQGTSLLGGWFPISFEILTIVILLVSSAGEPGGADWCGYRPVR